MIGYVLKCTKLLLTRPQSYLILESEHAGVLIMLPCHAHFLTRATIQPQQRLQRVGSIFINKEKFTIMQMCWIPDGFLSQGLLNTGMYSSKSVFQTVKKNLANANARKCPAKKQRPFLQFGRT